MTNPEEVNSTVNDIAKQFGGHIDILVGAAGTRLCRSRLTQGICENIPVLEYPIEDFKKVIVTQESSKS